MAIKLGDSLFFCAYKVSSPHTRADRHKAGSQKYYGGRCMYTACPDYNYIYIQPRDNYVVATGRCGSPCVVV